MVVDVEGVCCVWVSGVEVVCVCVGEEFGSSRYF